MAVGAKVGVGRGLVVGVGPGLGQLAAGADFARQHVQHGPGPGLTAQRAVHEGTAAAQPGRFQRGACAQHHHHVGVHLRDGFQQVQLVDGQLHIGAVDALALLDLIEAQKEQDGVGLPGQCHGFGLAGVVGAALPVKTGGKAHAGKAGGFDAVQHRIHLKGVDGAGACALIPGRLGKIADDGHLLARLEGQQAALVLEQDDALRRRTAGQLVVGRGVKGLRGLFHGGVGVQHQLQKLVQPGIHIGLGDLAALHGSLQLPDGVPAGEGHFQRGAVLHAQRVVVGATPVGDDGPLKAPVPAQNIQQQVGVLVGVGAVDEVVGGHDGLGVGLLDHDLKAGEVELPEGALVQHRVAGHPAQLLAVDGKVLGAGGNAVFLDAPHIARRHFAGEERVLRKILKVAAAQGAALDVQARAQQHGHLLRGSLLAQSLAHGFAQLRVPAAGHGGAGGEAGGRDRRVQAQMVRCARLLAHAVGAIGEGDGRDAFFREIPGGEHRLARKQSAFLLQIQFLDDIGMFHRNFLVCF